MRKTQTTLSLLILGIFVVLNGSLVTAQEASKPKTETKLQEVYRLEFVVRELEGETRINSRAYSMSVKVGDMGKIRVGSQIPIAVGDKTFQYDDIGINIDCRVEVQEEGLLLWTNFESSSVVRENDPRVAEAAGSKDWVLGVGGNAIRRRVSFNGESLVTTGKPTIIAKLDDVGTNRRYEVEVTATKAK